MMISCVIMWSSRHPTVIMMICEILKEILHQVNEILKSLCDADMLHTDPGHELTYHFKHASLREVSYTLLPEELREQLHFAAAAYYEVMIT